MGYITKELEEVIEFQDFIHPLVEACLDDFLEVFPEAEDYTVIFNREARTFVIVSSCKKFRKEYEYRA